MGGRDAYHDSCSCPPGPHRLPSGQFIAFIARGADSADG